MGGVANPSLKMGLHLYHHLITPTIVFVTWFYPCTGGWVGPLSNSLVHVVMYAYYGISVVYPGIKKYGNVVTYVQLTQFISVILYHVVCFILTNSDEGCWLSAINCRLLIVIIFRSGSYPTLEDVSIVINTSCSSTLLSMSSSWLSSSSSCQCKLQTPPIATGKAVY